jgi:intein-encoded DNA endonuclease-like protein
LPNWANQFTTQPIEKKELDENLAYILGVLIGDGNLYKDKRMNSYKIELVAKHEAFVNSFGDALKKLGFTPHYGIKHVKWCNKNYYRVTAHNRAIAWLKDYMQKLEYILNRPELKIAFIKGFYESEGSSVTGKQWRVRMFGVNSSLLKLVQRFLLDLGFNFSLYLSKGSKNLYELSSTNSEQNLKFLNTINPCIKNKKPDKLPSRKRHPEQYCLALKLNKEFGWGYKKIGKYIIMSPWTIRYWLRGY